MPSYTFYFEINNNNIGEVCSSLPHSKSWTGFDWTNANYGGPLQTCYKNCNYFMIIFSSYNDFN